MSQNVAILIGEDHIGTSPMTVGIENPLLLLNKPRSLNSSLGVSLAGIASEDVGVAEVPTPVFQVPVLQAF